MTDGGHLDSSDDRRTGGPAQAPAARKGLSVGAILGIVGGGLVLLVVVVVVIAVVIVSNITKSSTASTSANASGVVRSYLTAIADAKASKALTYLTEPDATNPLLTQAVLAESQKLEPISHITVGKPTNDTYFPDVTAKYTLGTHAVSAVFHLSQGDDGSYTISSGLAPLTATYLKGLDVTVNGVRTTVPDNGLKVFPGAYTIAVTTPSLTLAGSGRIELTGPDASLAYDALKPKLTDAGVTKFRTAVAAAVKACLAQTTLKAGCGLTLPSKLSDGSTVDEGSVRRSSTPQITAKLAHLQPTPDTDTPTLMSASISESPDVTATGSKSGVHGRFSLLFGPSLQTASIDVSQANPVVEWG